MSHLDSFEHQVPSARWTFFNPKASSLRCKDETRADALKQSSLLALRYGGRVPRKISNACLRDMSSKLSK